ncbi:superoxide dismutase [Aquibacillus albus]|uniref:superoxide dismutase n=1 Tax=Aquibacillus albus TaxID=1168171 RepID=A0ABS2MVE9_9BACI|nr:superoxide dismutase [Aquibacillus albus]MBM7569778.1 Fe-Mn family superoxide dismutase [Aquibacillus albus]
MDNKKLEYLAALLKWAEKAEASLAKVNTEHIGIKSWYEQLGEIKETIQQKLEMNEDVTDSFIYDIQNKSEKLTEEWKDVLKNPRQAADFIAPGNHELPPLPYAYDALEPYISKEIMELHHKKHHQSYVDGLNKAEKELYVNKPEKAMIKHWMREQAFHGSGHYLHTIFWNNMTPQGGGAPTGSLLNQIKKDFGSFKNFKQLFTKAAESAEGVGWAILVWEPRAGRLGIQTAEKHQLFSLWDTTPLLVLDVWEHAYYLQYKNNRLEYINNWWKVVNWNDVQNRYNQAKKLVWTLY